MLLFAAAATAGCASGPKMAPGKSAAEIAVKAEPKKGYHPPSDPASYAGGAADQLAAPSAAASNNPMTLLDYNGLYGIVVWLEPASGAVPNSTPKSLPLASPNTKPVDDASPRIAAVGDRLVILNRASTTDTFYLRFDDGSVADIGSIGGGKTGAYTLKRPGAQSVISDSLDRPIDRLFVAPSPLYKIAHCNSTVNFTEIEPGEYRLKSWHYRLPGSSTNLTLVAGKVTKSTVVIGVNALPKVP